LTAVYDNKSQKTFVTDAENVSN